MSSTTTTQYYGLTQYIGTDKPDWTDNNEAFREVDADLHEAVQSMEGFGTDIAALQEAQNALTTEVTGLEADLNTEKAKITALQNKETLQDAEIAGVKADALDMIEAKDEGTAQVATVAVAAGEYFRYNDVLYIATINIAVGDTIVPNTNCRATNVGAELEELKSDLYKGSVSVTADGVKTLSQLLDSLYALADRSKISKDSKLISDGVVAHISTITLNNTVFDFGAIRATCQLFSYRMISTGSTAFKVDFNPDSLTRTTMSSDVIESGKTLTLYY